MDEEYAMDKGSPKSETAMSERSPKQDKKRKPKDKTNDFIRLLNIVFKK
jgi:hypothetical protein